MVLKKKIQLTMKVLRNVFAVLLLTGSISTVAFAQCGKWNDLPNKDDIENAHSLYRPFVKGKQPDDLAKMSEENFNLGFNNWKKAYEAAPAADGNRPSHYSDGRLFYKALLKRDQDQSKHDEYQDIIMRLYDEQIECYKNEAFLLGRKAFDMFYSPKFGYRQATLDAFNIALEKGGLKSEYIVFDPMAKVLVYLYGKEKVTPEEARRVYLKLEEVAEHNIKNNQTYGQYYDSAWKIAKNEYKKIEDEIFDCAYFKGKLLPEFNENKEDIEVVKYVYSKLRQQGCAEDDPELVEVRTTYEAIAAEMNEEIERKRREENPCYDASQLQKEGKYTEAVARYQECIDAGDQSDEALAQVYYSMASIEFRQNKSYSKARNLALKAAKLKPNWGRPYMMIGDMYSSTVSSCGKDAYNRGLAVLAAIDKYSYAKSIDPEVASEASSRIGRISSAKPPKEDVFMSKTEGKKVKVKCWIGETVTVRY